MTIFSKNLGGHGPFGPLLATPMLCYRCCALKLQTRGSYHFFINLIEKIATPAAHLTQDRKRPQ